MVAGDICCLGVPPVVPPPSIGGEGGFRPVPITLLLFMFLGGDVFGEGLVIITVSLENQSKFCSIIYFAMFGLVKYLKLSEILIDQHDVYDFLASLVAIQCAFFLIIFLALSCPTESVPLKKKHLFFSFC